jgi:large-conductance mechanosensitive channel
MDNIVYSSVKHTTGFYETLMNFLNTKSGTLMTSAMGVAIGMAYKDAVVAIVDSVVKPLIVYIILATKLDKLYDFTYFFQTQDNALNIAVLLKNVISFFIIVAVVYYLYKLTGRVSPNDDTSDSSSVYSGVYSGV